jgi:hypothetical protein
VVRLNLASEVNRQWAERVGVTDTPSFVLFNRSGKELRRWTSQAPAPSELPAE